MAGNRFKIKAPESLNLREWMWVIIIGVVLAIVALVSRGGVTLPATTTAADVCQVTVSVDSLNELSAPTAGAPAQGTLKRGDTVAATSTVTGGYRKLVSGLWVLGVDVVPAAGTKCS